MRDASLVADLECSGCGRPLIKDRCLKCTRCDALVPATLGEARIYCQNCSSPRVLLARNDEAMCPESKSRCSNRRDNKGTLMKLAVSEETEMVQEDVALSKTQELRDWLDAEIKRRAEDIYLLEKTLNPRFKWDEPLLRAIMGDEAFENWYNNPGRNSGDPDPWDIIVLNRSACFRYRGLLSRQREEKMEEDREELGEMRKRLELLRSARELDVDVDALEKTIPTLSLEIRKFNYGAEVGIVRGSCQHLELSMHLATREVFMRRPQGDTFIFGGLESVEVGGNTIRWYFPIQIVTLSHYGQFRIDPIRK